MTSGTHIKEGEMKSIRVILIFEAILVALCIFACGYKVAKDETRELTADEREAAEITERLRERRYERIVESDIYRSGDVGIDNGNTVVNQSTETQEVETGDEHWILDTDNSSDWVDSTELEAPYEAEEKEDRDEVYTFTEDEIWEMTRIVYLENGIVEESTDETLYLTACVILNRLYDWEECSTVYEVIWQGGQYSTANRYEDYNGNPLGSYEEGWARSYNAVCQAIENTDRNPHFQSTFAQGDIYYIDPNTGEIFCY